jgi:hypothetical protein
MDHKQEGSTKDFFVSYNSADRQWAEWIAWQLEETGYTTVLQAWDFRPGSNFVLEMQRAATKAKRTIAVLSQAYLDALYTQPEWAAAFGRDPTGEKGALLPVRVQECDLEGLLPQIVYVDLVGLEETAARDTLLAGVRRERAKPTTAPAFPRSERRTVARPERYPGEVTVPLRADIRLKVVRQEFRSSIGISIPHPRPKFRAQWNPEGYDKQGLPDCGSLWARIEITNIGFEKGLLKWEFDGARLPSLFDSDKIDVNFYGPEEIAGRALPCTGDFYFYIPFAEQDPQAFAQTLKALIESKARYEIVIRYWTKGVEGESETRKLPIEVNFQGFYQELLQHWDGFGFKDLADLARPAES